MDIVVLGADKRLLYAKEALMREAGDLPYRVHLLPIPSSRDVVHITGTEASLSGYLSGLSAGDALVCYGLCPEMLSPLEKRGVIGIDLARDEDYTGEGAYLTAVGTVGYILKHLTRAPSDLRIGIVGIGRIGTELSRMLLALGAELILFSGRACETLCSQGAQVLGYEALTSGGFPPLDILINTAPAQILTSPLPEALTDAKIIELASGDNIPREIPHECLPQLPARAYPESAGRAVAKAVLRLLQ